MSRIGKLPIKIPSNVNIEYNERKIIVTGKFGTLQAQIPNILEIKQINDNLIINLKNKTRTGSALHGLHRTLINNMIIGVSEQFQLKLNLQGVGYRATVKDRQLILNLGYSHIVEVAIPEGIFVNIIQNTIIDLKSCDKAQLGLFAAKIRSWRPPEPYKGKGILYENETINRKVGKSGKK